MVDGGGVSFSVVYFDGETEANVGEVTVDSSFNFNKFLSFLSHKIGISPSQLSVYLATFGSNRRIPITGKFNFADLTRENDNAAASFFFVKRSKRPRRSKPRGKASSRNDNTAPPGNVVLLRRDAASAAVKTFSGFGDVPGRAEYEKRVRDLQIERERYLMRMGIGGLCLGREASNGGGVVCEECSKGRDGGFHWCVYDAVTVGFRSPAGPVARPVRGSG